MQHLNHSYAEVLFISIFQNSASDFPFLRKFYFFAIEVPILHFLVFKDQCSEYGLRSQNRIPAGWHGTQVPVGGNESCITPNEKYEDYQFKLGKLVKILSSQGDSGIGFSI